MRRALAATLAIWVAASDATAAPADDPETAREARALYAEGARLYDLAQYDEAIARFRSAYGLTGSPGLLFNIAQAYRLKGAAHCAEALQLYESYERQDPAPSNRAELGQRITEMRDCVEKRRAAAPPPSVAAGVDVSAKAAEPARATAPLWILAGGVTAVAVGGILYGLAYAEYRSVEATCPCPGRSFDGWKQLTYASYGLVAVGAAGVVVGGAWWLRGRGEARIAVAPAAGGLALRGRF